MLVNGVAPLNRAVLAAVGTVPKDQLVGAVGSDQRLDTAPVQVSVWAVATGVARVRKVSAAKMPTPVWRECRSMVESSRFDGGIALRCRPTSERFRHQNENSPPCCDTLSKPVSAWWRVLVLMAESL